MNRFLSDIFFFIFDFYVFKDLNISLLACKLIRLSTYAMRHIQGQCDDAFNKDDKNFKSMFVQHHGKHKQMCLQM